MPTPRTPLGGERTRPPCCNPCAGECRPHLAGPLRAGHPGFELLDGLPAPIDYDFFVWKGVEPDHHPYGACYHDLAERRSTGLIEFLQARGVATVLVGGLATDYCVKTSVLQLRRAGFRVIVHLDACRGIAPETVDQARTRMIEAGAELAQTLADVNACWTPDMPPFSTAHRHRRPPSQQPGERVSRAAACEEPDMPPILHSLLDTDAYKLHMQQAVFHRYPDADVVAEFHSRNEEICCP